MKNTKVLIMATALRLFNRDGLAKTTLRTIAKEMNISQGNLNYHFKKREDIVEGLYLELVAKMDVMMEQSQQGPFDMQAMYRSFRQMMVNFYEYRFFMLDFVTVMRAHESILKHYRQLQQLRKQQFFEIIALLVDMGIVRKAEFPREYEELEVRLQIMGDFWLSAAIIKEELSPEVIDRYGQIIFHSFYPYFTPKGKAEFLEQL